MVVHGFCVELTLLLREGWPAALDATQCVAYGWASRDLVRLETDTAAAVFSVAFGKERG